jgi:hypothetical protein
MANRFGVTKLDVAQKGALRFYAWAGWFGAVAWIVSKYSAFSAANGGTEQSWLFLNLFAVIALAPKGIQGMSFAASYRPGCVPKGQLAKGIRLAIYAGIWWLLLVAGIFGVYA